MGIETFEESGFVSRAVANRARSPVVITATVSLVRRELAPLPVLDTHVLEDVSRILALTPEERLLEVRNVSRFDAAARRALLVTSAGRVDVTHLPAGSEGYEDLARRAIRFDVFGAELLAASLADIIRSKEAADRPQDRQDVVVLREILRRKAGDE